MKILVLTTKPPWPPHDGGAFATLRCIEGLAENGASVSVLAMKTHKHASLRKDVTDIIPHVAAYETIEIDTEINYIAAASNLIFSDEPYDMIRFVSDRYSQRIKSLLAETSFDIIQCEGPVFSYYYDQIRSKTGTPVVLRAHNIEHRIRAMMADQSHCLSEKIYLKNLSARIRKREIYAAEKSDAIVPIAEPDMNWFASVCPDKPLMLAETGVNEVSASPVSNNDSLRVGFIGALDWKPNIQGLTWFIRRVWPWVRANVPSATLHIAGRNASPTVHRTISGEGIVYEGEVADSRAFISGMTVMIAPLFAGSGLRIKIIEAMSLGKTIVATPAAANGLPVTDLKEILVGNDEQMFIRILSEALNNRELRENTGKEALNMIRRRYDNRAITANLLQFYKQLSHDR